MFRAADLAGVAVDEFRRGLEGLTAEEAMERFEKRDGTRMNAISWTILHIGAHWANVATAAAGLPLSTPGPPRDGTPPPFEDALQVFEQATQDLSWIENTSDEPFLRALSELRGESVGTFLARAIAHTWFHIGEINAVRQLLGHAEIRFVGPAGARMVWVPDRL
jgi:hypothetical protein